MTITRNYPSGTTAQLRVRWSRRDGSPLPRSAYESGGGDTLYIRGVGEGDAGDYACEAVDARSGTVVFTAVTTLTVSGDFYTQHQCSLDHVRRLHSKTS